MRLASWLTILVAALALPLATPRPNETAQSVPSARKLSAITASDGTVKAAVVAGDRVVFLADYDKRGRADLYSAPLSGGAPLRLTANLPGSTVSAFKVNASGLVVFSLARGTGPVQTYYLYSVPVTGDEPTLLGPTYPAQPPPGMKPGGTMLEFDLAGGHVIFRADVKYAMGFELFSVPAAGGQPVLLSEPLLQTQGDSPPLMPTWVTSFAISADASQVAFLQETPSPDRRIALYAAPATGGAAPALLDGSLNPDNLKYAIAADGSYVAYRAGGVLRTVAASGGPTALIQAGGRLDFAISSDSTRLVYGTSGTYSTTMTLKSVPLAGGPAVTLTDNVYKYYTGNFVLTPDGSSVLYNNADRTALLRVPTLGGASQTVIDAGVIAADVRFTADGAYALFVTEWLGDYTLYSYSMAGGVTTRLDDPALSAGVGNYLALEGVTPGGRVLYVARTGAATSLQLYSVPVGGGATTTLSGDFGLKGGAISVCATAADGTVIFVRGPVASPVSGPTPYEYDWRRIYAVPTDGTTPARLVDEPRGIAGDVHSFAVSQAHGRAVYLADQTTDELRELFSVPLAGGPTTRLNAAGQAVASFALSPQGDRVVYEALEAGETRVTLFSVPISGGAAAPLGAPLPSDRADYAFTPDGSRVVYRASTNSPDANTLYSAPSLGGTATVIADQVRHFFLDPTSARVVFLNDQLRSAPVAGGSIATLGPVGLRTTYGFALITPDGARVIYEPLRGPGMRAFVSQPIAGGAITTLTPLADNQPFGLQLSADGRYLLYSAQVLPAGSGDQLRFRIQRIPVAGGPAFTLLELTAPAGSAQQPPEFTQAPGGGPLVYNFVSQDPASTQFGSVPISGGPPTLLAKPLDITHVGAYALNDSGTQVLFSASDALYRVPAAGGATPIRVAATEAYGFAFSFAGDDALLVRDRMLFYAPRGGGVAPFARPADGALIQSFRAAGETVVFTGERDSDSQYSTFELYAADMPALSTYLPLVQR